MTIMPSPLIVVMGVSGCGKSTIGARIALALSVPFIDADDLHPVHNVEKMSSGIPLTDSDRWPWLELVGQRLADHAAGGAVVACSALRRTYRDAIRGRAPTAIFVHLSGRREVLAERIDSRENHFMPLGLLDSQLGALEPLEPDESGFSIEIDDSIEGMLRSALVRLGAS